MSRKRIYQTLFPVVALIMLSFTAVPWAQEKQEKQEKKEEKKEGNKEKAAPQLSLIHI